MSTSVLTKVILLSTCCNFALIFAIFIAFLEISSPTPIEFSLSNKMDISIDPDPVPISSIFLHLSLGKFATNLTNEGYYNF